MKPVAVEQPRFELPTELMMLDDAEMVLQLTELAQTTMIRDRKVHTATAPVRTSDWATEIYAAASCIMDPEECEALVKEIEAMEHPLIAA